MALRDYYRCKQCDAKIAYGPDRSDEDWEPFLLCRDCLATLRSENERLKVALDTVKEQACKHLCEMCRDGIPVKLYPGGWFHEGLREPSKYGSWPWMCYASPFKTMIAQLKEELCQTP